MNCLMVAFLCVPIAAISTVAVESFIPIKQGGAVIGVALASPSLGWPLRASGQPSTWRLLH